jgi:hypothetical protein
MTANTPIINRKEAKGCHSRPSTDQVSGNKLATATTVQTRPSEWATIRKSSIPGRINTSEHHQRNRCEHESDAKQSEDDADLDGEG